MFSTNGTPKKTTKKDKSPLDTTERARVQRREAVKQ
jgi:hypothetical protein